MRRFPAGRIFGVRLWLHWSWFFVFGLIVWVTTADFEVLYPLLASGERVAMGLVTGVLFFACLAAHELAHALVARRFGVTVLGITLFLFGGVAEIEGEVPTPAREFAVALAGPATSVAIGSVFGLLSVWAGRAPWPGVEGVLLTLAFINGGVAVFNLIPGLPLDGGRLLRAGLWRITGSFQRATKVAATGGMLVALILTLAGAALAFTGTPEGLWYIPMGAFLWLLARASSRARTPVPTGALALAHREMPSPEPHA